MSAKANGLFKTATEGVVRSEHRVVGYAVLRLLDTHAAKSMINENTRVSNLP